MILRIFSILLLVSTLTPPLAAQGSASPETQVRIDLMPISLSGNLVVYYAMNGKVKKLQAFETGIGTPVFYKGNQTLRLYATEEEAYPRPPDQPQPTPLASVMLPTGVRRVLLLPIPKPDKKLEIRALGVDDRALSAGDYRLYNLSSLELVGLMGKKPLQLKPGQTQDVSDASMRQSDEDLGVQIAYLKDKKQKLIYSSMWGHSIEARCYIFMVGTGNPNSPLSVRKFHDVPKIRPIGYEPENP